MNIILLFSCLAVPATVVSSLIEAIATRKFISHLHVLLHSLMLYAYTQACTQIIHKTVAVHIIPTRGPPEAAVNWRHSSPSRHIQERRGATLWEYR